MMDSDKSEGRLHRLPEMRPAEIDRPGSYLVTETGRLLRVTWESLGWNLAVAIPSGAWVARLSDNPSEPITNLRQTADINGYFVNF